MFSFSQHSNLVDACEGFLEESAIRSELNKTGAGAGAGAVNGNDHRAVLILSVSTLGGGLSGETDNLKPHSRSPSLSWHSTTQQGLFAANATLLRNTNPFHT
jgi:hypothetical protein